MPEDRIDPLLGPPLRRAAPAPDTCPDAEQLGAWVDRGLSASESRLVETHVASCGDCRRAVALLLQSGDAVPVPAASGKPRQWIHAKWLPLAATVVIAFGVWLAWATGRAPVVKVTDSVPRQAPVAAVTEPRSDQPAASGPTASQQPASEATALHPSPASPQAAKEEARQLTRSFAPKTAPPQPAAELVPARSPVQVARSADEAQHKPDDKSVERAVQLAVAEDRLREELFRKAAASKDTATIPAAGPVQAGGTSAPPPSITAVRVARQPEPPPSARAPGGLVRWRVVSNGTRVERSDDGGVNWMEAFRDDTASVKALAAPDNSTLWLAGDQGLVVRWTPRNGWQPLPKPADEELVMIAAPTADTATVITRSGRVFATNDAGQTWLPKP